jgi:hypothetical protein
MIPLRLYAYAVAALALVAGFLWYRHSLIAEGEDRVYAAQQLAAHEQAVKDARLTQETVDGLKGEMDHLRELALQPVPVVRLCTTPRPVRPATVASRTPDRPASTGDVPVVSDGTGSGPNVGPGLLELAEAADIVSARGRACLAWARGISK